MKRQASSEAPVELRFVDLFMALVGSLVFLIFLYSTLLLGGRAASNKELLEKAKELNDFKAELKTLKDKVTEIQDRSKAIDPANRHGWFDSDIVERWIVIRVSVIGCPAEHLPELYMRPVHELFDASTGKSVGYANRFDFTNIVNAREVFEGDLYEDREIGKGSVDKMYYGVIGDDTDLFVALTNPNSLEDQKCLVSPHLKYATFQGRQLVYHATLDRMHPYALLGRIGVAADGQILVDIPIHPSGHWPVEIRQLSVDQCHGRVACQIFPASLVAG